MEGCHNAYGVEWDDPERGKHDGGLDGIEYYKCNVNGAGSFIKSTRVLDPDQSFQEALNKKYFLEQEERDLVRISRSKVIENVVGSSSLDDSSNNFQILRSFHYRGNVLIHISDHWKTCV